MPHVIFSGSTDLTRYHSQFQPAKLEDEGWIIRLGECYRAALHDILIVDCVAVRSGFSQNFYARIEEKGGSYTVRVDPMMKIERNEGIQRTIAAIARHFHAAGGVTYDKSNLPERILKPLTEAIVQS